MSRASHPCDDGRGDGDKDSHQAKIPHRLECPLDQFALVGHRLVRAEPSGHMTRRLGHLPLQFLASDIPSTLGVVVTGGGHPDMMPGVPRCFYEPCAAS